LKNFVVNGLLYYAEGYKMPRYMSMESPLYMDVTIQVAVRP